MVESSGSTFSLAWHKSLDWIRSLASHSNIYIYNIIVYSAMVWQQGSLIIKPDWEYFPSVLVHDVTTALNALNR